MHYENVSNERWDVTSPNITYSKFDNANNWPWYSQIYPPFSLKSFAEHFNLRKTFKFKTQVLHYVVSHHILPMAFRKTVGYETTTRNQQQTRVTVLV